MTQSTFRYTALLKEDGARLDKVLADAIPDLSRTRVKSLIEQGTVTADGQGIADPAFRVKHGQNFAMIIPDAAETSIVAEAIPLDVLHEDEDLIVLNKQAGMVVHPAAGNLNGTLVNALLAHCGGSLSGVGGELRPGIVHRLDKDTSGLMVVAKNDAAHQHLSAQFADRTIERAYTAIVWGVPQPAAGTIEGNIGRSDRDRKKMAMVRAPKGRYARTHYQVTRRFGQHAAMVTCKLDTGRTHQIRVHLTHKGHPLVGDPVYGRETASRRSALSEQGQGFLATFNRQALHANVIGFIHPSDGRPRRFEREIPQDMKALAENL